MVRGYDWRADRALWRDARLVSHLIQPHVKDKLTPKKFHDAWTRKDLQRTTENQEADFAEMWRRHQLRMASQTTLVVAGPDVYEGEDEAQDSED